LKVEGLAKFDDLPIRHIGEGQFGMMKIEAVEFAQLKSGTSVSGSLGVPA
jgi:hypothetical protein